MHLVPDAKDTAALLKLARSADTRFQRTASTVLDPSPLGDDEKEMLASLAESRGHTSEDRPPFADVAGWKKMLDALPGKPDLARGREVFLSPRLGGCTLCHRVDGIGATAGPDLSTIGSAPEADYVLESLLQPSRNVAPQYESFSLETTDGQTRVVFQLMERGGSHTYVGLDGKPFEIKIEDIVKREHLPVSIMPEGLVARLTDEEVRDLVAFLKSRKSTGTPRGL
jgi:putative heme-binding domain-containing protein